MNLIVKCERELETMTLHEGLKNVSRTYQTENENFSVQEFDTNSGFQNNKRNNKANVARQLDFLSDQHKKTKYHSDDFNEEYASAASSPECLEVDMSHDSLNDKDDSVATDQVDVNLCDSGVCEDDSSSIISDTVSDPQCCREDNSSMTVENSYNSNDMETWDEDSVTECEVDKENAYITTCSSKRSLSDEGDAQNKRQKKEEITRVRGRSRQLTSHQTDVLSNWYKIHIRYPYPSDLEVKQLSEVTGLKQQQVKKWMANKRVRNFNTLSISGNQHPIKFKFKGNRENDAVKNTVKPNYQQLNPESRKILNEWYNDHSDHPYPDNNAKQTLAEKAGISEEQVKSWFANKRSRAQNTKRQVPNYFIKKFPEYASHVHMVSVGRELARKARRQNTEALNAIPGVYQY
ncbi:hypothetical protein FSP39_005066 [Pinctada imbricata]|uniref:Homeobox domain-containing protein n=1 Tax=Pinctada imbricata TaxID=66713 RepID=A0AA88XPX0_PINIB|nr:hypothetical protein FSP39_005066 [Pinctada imbricata]